MTDSAQPYRVLARKYRPQRFSELIGQDAMIQTLANAIARDRLAHAFLLTGVRGVGKTSTARLIAKSLNCVGPDGTGGPTIDPCGQCEPCTAIAEGRHIDVVEMDAASHTGVDDVREIIEAVRYAAVSARYKVYIIDEVHMLSKSAFNALLKTLEEPPAHVKFLFATTEIQKVPVTVLSRCQRFDLKRIPAELLAAHFAHVAAAEGVTAEPDALAVIARAAEGSARDGLSILDQAIAHGEGGAVTAAQVRDMLGLSDRGVIRQQFAAMMTGDAMLTLDLMRRQYDLGVEPAAVFRALLELVHGITRTKVATADDPAMSSEERAALVEWASQLGHGTLHRLWQLLLKGLDEIQTAPMPADAGEMALLRIIHASTLPDPGTLVRRLTESGDGEGVTAPAVAPVPVAETQAPLLAASAMAPVMVMPAPEVDPVPSSNVPADFPGLVALAAANQAYQLEQKLHDEVRLVDYRPGVLSFATVGSDTRWVEKLRPALKEWTGLTWDVRIAEGDAQPSLRAQEEARIAGEREMIKATPLVRAALDAFPDAELEHYRLPDSKVA